MQVIYVDLMKAQNNSGTFWLHEEMKFTCMAFLSFEYMM